MTNEITLPALLLELGITVCVRVSDLQCTQHFLYTVYKSLTLTPIPSSVYHPYLEVVFLNVECRYM